LVISLMSQLMEALSSESDSGAKKSRTSRLILELADRKRRKSDGSLVMRAVKFPQKAKGASARPLAQLLRVMDLMHEALISDVPTTKRDLYYKDVSLFKSQAVVDRLIDDLAATFGLGRADLNVRASSKGLVCGSSLVIELVGGDIVEVNDAEGTLIPVAEEIARFDVDAALYWVLIVEKEAVFQTLCRHKFTRHPSLPGHGLIITGKGYPDVATRQLVRTLSDNLPDCIPILALVDGDAYGIDILSVYKFGSISMGHEKEKLASRRIKWLGIRTSELASLGLTKDSLIPITKHDEKKALAMLHRSGVPKKWRRELQYMLHNRRKAEIEVLSSVQSPSNTAASSDEIDGSPTTGCDQDPHLVRYLIDRISFYIARCRQESA